MSQQLLNIIDDLAFFDVKRYLFDKDIIIFGASKQGVKVNNFLREYQFHINYFCDNDSSKWNQTLNGVKIISPKELPLFNQDKTIIVICSDWYQEISDQLNDLGLNNYLCLNSNFIEIFDSPHFSKDELLNHRNEIEKVFELLSDEKSREVLAGLLKFRSSKNPKYLVKSSYEQYRHPIVKAREDDVIIDGGAFTGDSASLFLDMTNNKCKVFSFEPSFSNYNILKNWVGGLHNKDLVFPINKGLADKSEEFFLHTEGKENDSYFICSTGTEKISTVTIDEFSTANCLKVDLIKLDIEGFEYEALLGAKESICKWKPRLQICLYHKPEDIYKIPLFIQEQFRQHEYQFYLGHHDNSLYETVLYAV